MMEKMMKECMKPHALMHSLTGLGLGMLLVSFLALSGDMVLWLGLGALVVGIVGDYMVQSGNK